jgi:hypothetical protein
LISSKGDMNAFRLIPWISAAVGSRRKSGVRMDEIEVGFSKLMDKIKDQEQKTAELSDELRKKDAILLGRMAKAAVPVVSKAGLNLLERGKQDPKGDLYETRFYKDKVIVLGKTDPVKYRPDDPGKQVMDQFCVLAENGTFSELMYSSDGYLVDSYRQHLEPADALNLYGYDVMFMVYRAMKDYLEGADELVESLGKVLEFVFDKPVTHREEKKQKAG